MIYRKSKTNSPPNRRERRKLAAGKRLTPTDHKAITEAGDGLFEIIIIPTRDIILHDRELLHGVLEYRAAIPSIGPMCLFCDFRWTTLDQLMPVGFCFVRPETTPIRSSARWIATGICPTCMRLPNMLERTVGQLRQLWPDLHLLPVPHPTPDRVQ